MQVDTKLYFGLLLLVMVEDENIEEHNKVVMDSSNKSKRGFFDCLCAPFDWLKMLSNETHWSFVFAVLIANGVSQGLGGSLTRVGTEYYMKDEQKVQPSQSQVYLSIINIPWIVKPLWGLLTDVLPIFGFRRRPYIILAGLLGAISMLLLSLHENLHLAFALLALTAGSVGVAIADVTVDACVAENSNIHPSLAADMQTLCSFTNSFGGLLGYSLSGVFVHLIGPKGVFGLLVIPFGLVFSAGILLNEPAIPVFDYSQIFQNFSDACKNMRATLKHTYVWRPCVYMYISFFLSVNIHEGLFYWYTDSKGGPSFSEETVGFILSIGSVGSLSGAILYQHVLKDSRFRDVLFWAQLLLGLSGMLDLMLVWRVNLTFGIPDYFFVVIDESFSQMMGTLKWMPLLVLSSKLCPPGIEGTFFALLMSIDNFGVMSASWAGGLLLHLLNVTRTKFDNLWLAILIRNLLRVTPLLLLFLVPRGDPNASILPSEVLATKEEDDPEISESENVELVSLVTSVNGNGTLAF